jgi:hypothetical protein
MPSSQSLPRKPELLYIVCNPVGSRGAHPMNSSVVSGLIAEAEDWEISGY